MITDLWQTPVGDTYSFAGRYYQLARSTALPKPAQQPRPPVIIGGTGPRRTSRLAACYADEFNIPCADPRAAQFKRVRESCERAGRSPEAIRLSATVQICCGRDDREVSRRALALGRDLAELRQAGLTGSPDQVLDTIGRYREAGADRLYLAVLDLADLDHLELVGQGVPSAAAAL